MNRAYKGLWCSLASMCLPVWLSAQGVLYSGLPIVSQGISESTLNLYVEDTVLVPSLMAERVSEANLAAILPYGGSEEAQALGKVIVARRDMTLGNAMPYFYIAINHALARMYRNMSLNPGPNANEEASALGIDADVNTDHFKNLRDLVQVRPMKGQELRVEVYFSRARFNGAVKAIKLHSAQAFWEPSARRVVVFVDRALFRWLPYRAAWGARSPAETATHVRDYVIRLTLRDMGHELFHAVQSANTGAVYQRPYLAEAAAVFVQENLTWREEMYQLHGAQRVRGLPSLPPDSSPCRGLMKRLAPFGASAMFGLARAGPSVRSGAFSPTRALVADDAEFYSQTEHMLTTVYDLAPGFLLYATWLPRETFQKRFGPLLSGAPSATVAASLAPVDQEFGEWYQRFEQRLWDGPEREEAYATARKLVTFCLGEGQFLVAFLGARMMAALHPKSPTPLLYAGDIFYRVDIPFFALDYYAAAQARAKTEGLGDESELRLLSRLGDAYEQLGDLKSATSMFSRAGQGDVSKLDPLMLLPVLRSRLKGDFYRKLEESGGKQSSETMFLVNDYVSVLQLAGCPTEEEGRQIEVVEDAMDRGDIAAIRAAMVQHLSLVHRSLIRPGKPELSQLARWRDAQCKEQ